MKHLKAAAAFSFTPLLIASLTGCLANPAKPPGSLPGGTIAALSFTPGSNNVSIIPGHQPYKYGHLMLINEKPENTQVVRFPAVDRGEIDFAKGSLAFVDSNYTYLVGKDTKRIKNTIDGPRPDVVRVIPDTGSVLTAWNEKFTPDGYDYPFQIQGAEGGASGNFGKLVNGSAVCGDQAFIEESYNGHDGKSKETISVLHRLDHKTGAVSPVVKTVRPKGRSYIPIGEKYPCKDETVYQIVEGVPSTGKYYMQKLDTKKGEGILKEIEVDASEDPAMFSLEKAQGSSAMTIWNNRVYWVNAYAAKVFSCNLDGEDGRFEFDVEGQINPESVVSGVDLQGEVLTVFGSASSKDHRQFFVRRYSLKDGSNIGQRIEMTVPAEIPDINRATGLVGTTS